MLVKPEHWYMLFWTLGGLLALAPIYYGIWRLVRAVETIQFILQVTKR